MPQVRQKILRPAGHALGIPCRQCRVAAKNEPGDDARDVYGQKLTEGYRRLLKRAREKYQKSIAAGGSGFVAGGNGIPTPPPAGPPQIDLGKTLPISFSGVSSGSVMMSSTPLPIKFGAHDADANLNKSVKTAMRIAGKQRCVQLFSYVRDRTKDRA